MRPECIQLIYQNLVSKFSKYCLKTDTICFLLLSWHVFTTLELDINNLGILLWKIVKPPDHNKIKQQLEKYSKNINQPTLLFDVPKIIVVLICTKSLRQL